MPLIYYLNLAGYNCPTPQIEAKKALNNMAYGDLLEITVTNPVCHNAILDMIPNSGHTIMSHYNTGNSFVITIRK